MKYISSAYKKSKIKFFLLAHKIRNFFRCSKPVHVIICGCSRSGSTLIYNIMRAVIQEPTFSPSRELSATKTLKFSADNYITKRPLDLFEIENIQRLLGKVRTLKFIIMIRDPRSLVTSRHASVAHQYFQGYDYQFFINHSRGVKSFTNPGVVETFRAINKLSFDNSRFLLLKYEDLIADPDAVQDRIQEFIGMSMRSSFSDYTPSDLPVELSRALNGARPIDKANLDRWKAPEHRHRLERQFSLCPELYDIVARYEYSKLGSMRINANNAIDAKRGTIIAFHTPDELYANEAKRMKASIERFGLTHDITEIPTIGSWVENCSMKPTWILRKRKEIRGPLLYVDVDTVFHSDPWPYLSQYDGDIAVMIYRDGQLNSSTIWINDTPNALQLLEDWKLQCDQARDVYDQLVLQGIIEEQEREGSVLRVQRLPINLCYIFDRKKERILGEPIIENLQASRVVKARGARSARLERRAKRVSELDSYLSSIPKKEDISK